MKNIEWNFRISKEKIQVAEFIGSKFERLNPSDRFQQRLEMHNETSLRIKALELGDSGVYEIRIKTDPANVEDRALLLTVYVAVLAKWIECYPGLAGVWDKGFLCGFNPEPVPVPEIRNHSLSSTAAGCNVTLECLVPVREGVNISWTRGSPLRDLGDLERYQLSPEGRSLQLSLQLNPPESNFTCTASNPADQKSSSFVLPSICQSKGAHRPFSNLWCIVLTSFLLLLILGTAIWCCWMNKNLADPGARGG
ncbi:uncharacterized protein LOC142819719 [Pelodiscus sinensis]|uniref:uncharacterized protein LOC142819719 n=1 Tax=Pelodiscus sinensis TaxID=13735 RepID=UPI003F6BBA8B